MTAEPETGSILVVDDDRVNRTLLARTLVASGHEVQTAENGHRALEMLRADAFDVVLLDLLMPGLSGVDTLKQLKQRRPHLKVIILSAADLEQVAQGALALGADYYVCKPPSLGEIERLVSGFWPAHTKSFL